MTIKFLTFRYIISLLLLLLPTYLIAQNGFVRATVSDETTGELLPGATVMAVGTQLGTITDLDGKFNLSLPEGTYSIRISFVSYQPLVIENIKITQAKPYIIDNIKLKSSKIELNEVVITAKQVRNTDAALNTIKMKSSGLLDGISASSLKRIGDSDAASSMKRITGVSVEGGKYVFVRGLGDRYTKTMLNGVDVPGLDPDRNTIQMDIFPTSIIDNLIVHKSFNAEIPADFTGGVIDIEIKDFPEERMGKVSIGAAYNPNYHFNNNYLTYDGGKTDWLGYDDGSRAIPEKTNIPLFTDALTNEESAARYKEILKKFNPTMAAKKVRSNMDYDIGITYGNQHPLNKITIGYNFAVSYKNSSKLYQDVVMGKYGRSSDVNEYNMNAREYKTGSYGVNDVFLSALAGVAVKTKNSKIRLYLLHLQNGESKAGIFNQTTNNVGTTWKGFQHTLDYSQRSLSNILFDGKHNISNSKWEINWKLSPSSSSINDPDIRFTRYIIRANGDYEIGTESGFPERSWRELNETNLAGVLHITKKFNLNGNKSKIKFGGAYTYKKRDFEVLTYYINPRGNSDIYNYSGNPDELFRADNLWPKNDNISAGISYDPGFIPTNPSKFDANVNYSAAYASTSLAVLPKLTMVLGLRFEKVIQRYTGTNQLSTIKLDNEEVLNDSKFFPSIGVIYNVFDRQNIRISYSQTVARPSFKELSYAQIYDPVSDIMFIGGLNDDIGKLNDKDVVYWDGNLTVTDIRNFDARWEMYQKRGQMASISLFYKTFKHPIELVQLAAASQKTQLQPRNVGDGSVMGIEIEAKQSLGIISKSLERLTVNANFTYSKSKIEMGDTEYQDRLRTARKGQTIDEYREMAGQAPYIVNAGIAYDTGAESGILQGVEMGLFYNVQGETLTYIGSRNKPDIYTKPFHSLNFNSSKSFGADNKFQIGIKISNILNSNKEMVYKSYKANDEYFKQLRIGTTFSAKFSYRF